MILLLWLVVLALAGLLAVNLLITRIVESLVPPLGRFVTVDGLRLHVWDSGEKPGQEGPPLLFIHGWLGQLNHFAYALAALFPERRVVLIDRPGAGYSQAAPSAEMAAQGEIIAKAAAALGLRRPLVIGHSLGGGVALALALAQSQALSGLALIAPLTCMQDMPASYHALARQGFWARKITAWTLGPVITLLSAGVAKNTAFAPDPMPGDFGRRGGGLLAARPGALEAASREVPGQAKELASMQSRYAALALPVGVLFGAQDRQLDAKIQGERFCALAPDARLTLVEGGHMLPIAQPQVCENFIRGVLARI